MAGYLITLGDKRNEDLSIAVPVQDVFKNCCSTGTYSTWLSMKADSKKGTWARTKESTFSDYLGMQAGDLIFFFFERKIYGIGELINVGRDCKYWGYLGANKPLAYNAEDIVETRLYEEISPENRCVCFFKPYPQYYDIAIDMDEALTAYPSAFKSLRVIEGRSFIKMDDEETAALAALLIKNNANRYEDEPADIPTPVVFSTSIHEQVEKKVEGSDGYDFTAASILENYDACEYVSGVADGIASEQMVEAALVEWLSTKKDTFFDRWDYVCHQVAASPAKPVEYMEWIDVFGYKKCDSLTGFDIPIQFAIDKYFVVEIKRGKLSLASNRKKETQAQRDTKAVAVQVMKYVDWITKNYASGRYPMVSAMIVANSFDDEFIEYCRLNCMRNYNRGYRNATPAVWNEIKLVTYHFDGQKITFEQTYPQADSVHS